MALGPALLDDIDGGPFRAKAPPMPDSYLTYWATDTHRVTSTVR